MRRTTLRRIGEILELHRAPVVIDESATYRQIGVRGFGRGILDYGERPASDLSKLRYFGLAPERLVVSNIKGWEGAVATTGENESGRIASNRFLQYRTVADVDLEFLRHWLLSDPGLSALGAASPGSADRNRTLSIKNFEAIRIPLPGLKDQRRIAAHLGSVATSLHGLHEDCVHLDRHFTPAQLPSLFGGALRSADLAWVRVSDLLFSVNDTIHPGQEYRGATEFVGLEHIAPHLGKCFGAKPLGGESGRKFRFETGDVTYGYLRPYQNKVWVADRVGLCSVEQFVLRPRPDVTSAALSMLLRSEIVLDRVNEATNNLQLPRLRLGTLMGLPVPDIRLAPAALLTHCSRLELEIEALERTRERRRAALAALLSAARNEVFNSLR